MNNRNNDFLSVIKNIVLPVVAVFLILGAVALFANIGSSSGSSGGSYINTPEANYFKPTFAIANFSKDNDNWYCKSTIHGSAVIESAYDGKFDVLSYNKNSSGSGTGQTISFFNNTVFSEPVNPSKLETQFDINVKSDNRVNSKMSYQIAFNELSKTPFIATICTNANGFSFCVRADSEQPIIYDCTSSLAYDQWHTIKIVLDMSSTSDFKATFYANDIEIGHTNVYIGSLNNAPLLNSVNGVYFVSNSSVTSSIVLDNVSLYTLEKIEN